MPPTAGSPAVDSQGRPVQRPPEIQGNAIAEIIEQSAHVIPLSVRPPVPDAVIETIERVVSSIRTGTDVVDKDVVGRLISNQRDRAELLNNLVLTHDYDRLVRYLKARKALEEQLWLESEAGNLDAKEALLFLKLVIEESHAIYSRVQAGATPVEDVMALLNKVDHTFALGEKDLQRQFANTSPQGREIVRRVAYRLNKTAKGAAALAKAAKAAK